MSYTKPVIIDPYYAQPEWITSEITRKEFVPLSADATDHDVELFLILLFGFMGIPVDQSFQQSFEELLRQEEVALSGGIAFFQDEQRFVLPSCCCGVEGISEIIHSIQKQQSPWLGHDPFPGITYEGDKAFVWSDDPESCVSKGEMPIVFDYNELITSLEKSVEAMNQFIDGPLYEWIGKRDMLIADAVRDQMKKWLVKDSE
ncbi:hypothetical protein [Paenibacillus paeoniae]|uniref:Uncharacterized protein n=1 Tax=Paenibacillus paeoniae TaxID=2292705 RepID=A0A371PIR0_9BACL|nr:hypothetical protein [Paenibacillus paeoniae]REK76023.1 hypothetical protein DX130_02865 [Paenibacillus paeoniae]